MKGGHALPGAQPDGGHQEVAQPHHPDVGHLPTNSEEIVKGRAEEQANRRNYYAKSAVGKLYKTDRYEELPRHRALTMSDHPEDSMGGDLVEYLVVFPGAAPILRGTEVARGSPVKLSRVHLCPSRPRR